VVNLAVFASGSGSNLQALLDAEAQGTLSAHVKLVISNRATAGALERAQRQGREALHVSPGQFDTEAAYVTHLSELLTSRDIGLICLAGYLKKLPAALVAQYVGHVLNIHPAPLPRFGGAGMYGDRVHQAVLAAGVAHSGPTVHFVDLEYDTGPVAAHVSVPVQKGDTPASLALRVLDAEHRLYPLVVAAVVTGRLRLENGKVVGGLDAA
jgi:phosphoribosylglycinamide formyltransferase-1